MPSARIAILLILFLLGLPLWAQVKVSAGARVGFNMAHISKTEVPAGFDKKIMPGANFGGLLRVGFNETFGIQTELLFSQKGQRWVQKSDSVSNFQKLVSNYIEIPLLGVARVGGGKVKAVFYLGGYFAYWSGGYLQTSSQQDEQTIASSHTDQEFTSGERRFDAGITTGVGMDIKAGPGFVEITVRHNLGLADRSKSDLPHTKTYNCNLFVSTAYIIPFGK